MALVVKVPHAFLDAYGWDLYYRQVQQPHTHTVKCMCIHFKDCYYFMLLNQLQWICSRQFAKKNGHKFLKKYSPQKNRTLFQ